MPVHPADQSPDPCAAETVSMRPAYGPLSSTFPRPVLMRIHALAIALATAGALTASSLGAQSTVPAGSVLTLTDALALAKRNNPALQNSVNARRTAAAQVRAAAPA